MQRLDDLVIERQQPAPAIDQLFAVSRKLNAAALAAHNQRMADEGFEPLDLQGDRRLRASDALGRAREALLLGNEHEGAHQVEIEGRHRGHE